MNYIWPRSFFVAALISCIATTATAGGWAVVKTSSGVQYTVDKKNWLTIKTGMILPENSWINTGKRGRVTLQKETNVVNVNPGTLAGVIGLGGKLDKTVIAQQTGSVTLDLVRKSAPWMTVQTPFLAAVVKGTKFTVAVGRNEATVDVLRGRVGVTDPRRGESADIVSGQRARVDGSSRRSMEILGSGKIERLRVEKPQESPVPMTDEQSKDVNAERKSVDFEEADKAEQNNQQNENGDQNDNDRNRVTNNQTNENNSGSEAQTEQNNQNASLIQSQNNKKENKRRKKKDDENSRKSDNSEKFRSQSSKSEREMQDKSDNDSTNFSGTERQNIAEAFKQSEKLSLAASKLKNLDSETLDRLKSEDFDADSLKDLDDKTLKKLEKLIKKDPKWRRWLKAKKKNSN